MPDLKMKHMYAYIAVDEETGTEGIPAAMTRNGLMLPLIVSEEKNLEKMKALAQQFSNGTKKELTLVKFTTMEVITELKPDPEGEKAVAAPKLWDPFQLSAKPICPNCMAELSNASAVGSDDAAPQPEDLTVCIECMFILKFNKDMKLELIPEDEYKKIDPEAREMVELAQAALKAAKQDIFRKGQWPKESC